MEHHTAFYVGTADGEAFFVSLRITARHTHDADSGTRVKFNGTLVEVALGHAFEEVYNVALQSEHDGFGFRVAHAAVILDDLWLSVAVDESEEDKTLIVDALCGKTVNRWTDDFVFHALHPSLIGKRNGRHTAHTAGVQSSVALANAFVVLGFGEYLVMTTIGEHED